MTHSVAVKRLYRSHFRIHMDNDQGHRDAMQALRQGFGYNAGIVEDLEVYEI